MSLPAVGCIVVGCGVCLWITSIMLARRPRLRDPLQVLTIVMSFLLMVYVFLNTVTTATQ